MAKKKKKGTVASPAISFYLVATGTNTLSHILP